MDEKSLSHTSWNCKYHSVLVPKYRRKTIYGKLRKDIGKILRMLCDYKHVLFTPVSVKIHQKIRDHIAGISCQRELFAVVMCRHRADQRSVFQNDFCIITHGFPIGRDPQPSAAPFHQFSPQLFFQRGNHLADIGL